MFKVVFFCTANVCRSPVAAGAFLAAVESAGRGDRFWVESAGTHATVGTRAHPGSMRIAAAHGIDLSRHRSRPLVAADFREFDLLVAMDHDNLTAAYTIGPPALHHKLRLLRARCEPPMDVPDPLAGPPPGWPLKPGDSVAEAGFAALYTLIAAGVDSLRAELSADDAV